MYRWIGTGVALVVFFLRIFFAQGWYIGKCSVARKSHQEV
jgi:lipopolysaccharide biosynthesis regulator YciM